MTSRPHHVLKILKQETSNQLCLASQNYSSIIDACLITLAHIIIFKILNFLINFMDRPIIKPEPIMLSVLPIIPSRISHLLFLFYSYAIT